MLASIHPLLRSVGTTKRTGLGGAKSGSKMRGRAMKEGEKAFRQKVPCKMGLFKLVDDSNKTLELGCVCARLPSLVEKQDSFQVPTEGNMEGRVGCAAISFCIFSRVCALLSSSEEGDFT